MSDLNKTPNRQKFASLVSKLNPMDPDFTEKVLTLSADYGRRQDLISTLIKDYTEGEVEDKVFLTLDEDHTLINKLDGVIRAAIERFVVDNF